MNSIEYYFTAEKFGAYLLIALGVIAFAIAFYFIIEFKTSFWKGVATPFIIVALLEFIVGYSIINSSPKNITRVENSIKNEPQKIKTQEIPRMEKIMKSFVIFIIVEIVLIALGITLMFITMNDTFWRGLGLGLFIQASIILCFDFFAERRGLIYLEYLKEFVEKI